jgi:tetratricopeptide (TPR) repeat protein
MKSFQEKFDKQDFSSALIYINSASKIIEESNNKESKYYAIVENYQSILYYNLGAHDLALKKGLDALRLYEKFNIQKNDIYLVLLDDLGELYADKKDYNTSFKYCYESLELCKELLGTDNIEYGSILKNLGYNYYDTQQYTKAIEILRQAHYIYVRNDNTDPEILTINETLALSYETQSDIQNALKVTEENIELCTRIGEKEDHYTLNLLNQSKYYNSLGRYNEAINSAKKSIDICEKFHRTNDLLYLKSAMIMSSAELSLSNFDQALHYVEIANNYMEHYPYDYEDKCNNLIICSKIHQAIGNYTLAESELDKAKKEYGRNGKNNDKLYAVILNSYANLHADKGSYKEAIQKGIKEVQLALKEYGKESYEYITTLGNLADYYYLDKDYSNASRNFVTYYSLLKNRLLSNFSTMTSQECKYFWNKYLINYIFLPKLASKITDNQIVKCCYDGQLLSKNLLLNTNIEMNKLLMECGDISVINEFHRLQDNRAMLNHQNELPVSKRTIDTNSLSTLCEKMEKRLAEKSKLFGDATQNMKLTWHDVQNFLKPNDTAIEFIDFPIGKDSIEYAALVINKEINSPKMISLSLNNAYDKYAADMYTGNACKKMYNLVWKKLEPYMYNGGNVYFSPSGIFYKANIEVLCDSLGRMACEKYNLYRVSSTREICYDKKNERPKTASLYGNIDYFMGTNDMANVAKRYHITDNNYVATRGFDADPTDTRGALKPLEGTEKEVNDICEELKKDNISAVVVKGKEGTEESFKALSGKHTSIIHLATHGFFFDDKTKFMPYIENLMINDDSPTTDTSMKRAGLAFAGANNAWSEKTIPDNVDDGILLAEEIPTIDLRGCDLLVLSACETGLGDVTSDGVFGLQRGFKQAGVNTIVMSLWKVNDNATTFFMEQFYKNFTQGQTKQKAFLNAQKSLRNSKEFNDPKDWAAFIMLDAI